MSLHQLVANALWKFGKRPVWISTFLSSLQLCCVKSQRGCKMWTCCSGFSLFLAAFNASGDLSEVIMWQLFGCLELHEFMEEHGKNQR